MGKYKFNKSTDVLITDPCYIKKSHLPKDVEVISESTIYGDWSCFTYQGKLEGDERPGKWDDFYMKFWNEYNFTNKTQAEKSAMYDDFMKDKEQFKKDNQVLGEFCADSGQVAVYDYGKLLKCCPEAEEFVNTHPWCATVVKDFTGTVEYYVRTEADEEGKDYRTAHILGLSEDGQNDFFTIQCGF